MPTPFSQFRYLDVKGDKDAPRPSVTFQAQRKVRKTGEWVGSRQITVPNIKYGAVHWFQSSEVDDWKSPEWLDDEEKRVIVKVARNVGGQTEEFGYAIVQDSGHHQPVWIASLAIWGSAHDEASGWLIAPDQWEEDPNLEIQPWADFQQTYPFLPEP